MVCQTLNHYLVVFLSLISIGFDIFIEYTKLFSGQEVLTDCIPFRSCIQTLAFNNILEYGLKLQQRFWGPLLE